MTSAVSPKAQARTPYRRGLFVRRGMLPEGAAALAEKLTLRDSSRDDRRLCIECSNWQAGGTNCFAAAKETAARRDAIAAGVKPKPRHALSPITPLPGVLHRCSSFDFQRP